MLTLMIVVFFQLRFFVYEVDAEVIWPGSIRSALMYVMFATSCLLSNFTPLCSFISQCDKPQLTLTKGLGTNTGYNKTMQYTWVIGLRANTS